MSYRWLQDTLHEALIDALADRDDELVPRRRKPGKPPTSAISRLLPRLVESPGPLDTPCWLTTFAPRPDGYIDVNENPKRVRAHRIAYEHFVGPIPAGLVLDHLCRVPGCVNPCHLEPVPHAENVTRGMSAGAIAGRTNACKYGHSLDDAYVRANGHRYCRTCSHEYNLRRPGRSSRRDEEQRQADIGDEAAEREQQRAAP